MTLPARNRPRQPALGKFLLEQHDHHLNNHILTVGGGPMVVPLAGHPQGVSLTATQLDPCYVDLYEEDVNGQPNLTTLAAAGPPWQGVILKASEGTYYNWGTWGKKYWPIARSVGGARYGTTWKRGAYLYLRVDQDGVKQADWYLAAIMAAGGWGDGDLWPIIDLESGEQPPGASAQQVIDVTTKCANRITAVTGRMVMRYTGSYVRDLGIVNHMGCKLLWVPYWEKQLSPKAYLDQGYTLSDTWGWQGMSSEGNGGWANYPKQAPIGPGGAYVNVDITASIIMGGGDPAAVSLWTTAHLGSQVT